jgi:polyisoprenoid-binding protein YceI
MELKSTHIAVKSDGELVVTGDLTIKGVTRSVQFAVEGPSAATKDPWGGTRIGVEAKTTINRKDFGLTWNAALETGGFMVGEDIGITLDLEFVKQA